MRVEGKTFLVTGGGSGLGAATARRLAESGATSIILADLTQNEENLFTLVVALRTNLPGASQAQAEEIVAQAHHICPYSRATHGNIVVTTTVTTHAEEPATPKL